MHLCDASETKWFTVFVFGSHNVQGNHVIRRTDTPELPVNYWNIPNVTC